MLDSWLLLVIAGLVVTCVSLYVHTQRMESESLLQRARSEEELRTVELALENTRAQIYSQPIFPSPSLPLSPIPPRASEEQKEQFGEILRLRRAGKNITQIARELHLSVGAIETLVALED
ncbi:MAG: hypothetical protein NTX57_04155 [Armatimonadetes bacterium]|jgi:DNA-binding NarL/FixJ family response regulator|nr:hypothetical protein [Armatimonadota bacterium]